MGGLILELIAWNGQDIVESGGRLLVSDSIHLKIGGCSPLYQSEYFDYRANYEEQN